MKTETELFDAADAIGADLYGKLSDDATNKYPDDQHRREKYVGAAIGRLIHEHVKAVPGDAVNFMQYVNGLAVVGLIDTAIKIKEEQTM